ncbi:MAG: hypothetical protein KIS63_02955 [Caldilineales bacterium]|nr:hypothetical protein [Caldilineales bacterium]
MSILEAIILGLVQGLTEFLPVSSSIISSSSLVVGVDASSSRLRHHPASRHPTGWPISGATGGNWPRLCSTGCLAPG